MEGGGRATDQMGGEEAAADLKRRAELARSQSGGKYGQLHPYTTLGISPRATPREIKRAYIALSVRLHPDRNAAALADDCNAAFADLSAAYELLSDQRKRALFDATGGEKAGANAHDMPGGFQTEAEVNAGASARALVMLKILYLLT